MSKDGGHLRYLIEKSTSILEKYLTTIWLARGARRPHLADAAWKFQFGSIPASRMTVP
jgi:hypothetical protein